MAKAATIKVKLVSTADTGYFYVTKKNSRTMTEKLNLKKYDPVAKKHVEFKEAKIKYASGHIAQNKNRLIEAVFSFQGRSKPKA